MRTTVSFVRGFLRFLTHRFQTQTRRHRKGSAVLLISTERQSNGP